MLMTKTRVLYDNLNYMMSLKNGSSYVTYIQILSSKIPNFYRKYFSVCVQYYPNSCSVKVSYQSSLISSRKVQKLNDMVDRWADMAGLVEIYRGIVSP